MTAYIFNEKTGELVRCNVVIALRLRPAHMFKILSDAGEQFTATKSLSDALDLDDCRVASVVQALRRRLAPFGLVIESKQGSGYRLVVGSVPKWEPNIPPPVVLDGERP